MDCCVAAFHAVLEEIEKGGLNTEAQVFLNVLFPKPFIDRSHRILTKESVIVCYIAQNSQRTFWKVTTKRKVYYVFHNLDFDYCSCPSFQRDVIKEGRFPMCKHCLAVSICTSLAKKNDQNPLFQTEIVEDDVFTEIIATTATGSNLSPNPIKKICKSNWNRT